MQVSQARTVTVRGSAFRAISWMLLLAFTLQSFVTQTHIHGAFRGDVTHGTAVASGPIHKTAPTEDGTADCPFCQAIVHAGVFHAPSAQGLVLPPSSAVAAAPFIVASAIWSAFSHLWQSRAPPRN